VSVFCLVSAMNEKKENALVPRPSSAVEKTASGPKRILSSIVADTLVLASREQRAPMLARFRIGDYEWCEPDYRQILIWAEETGLKPEEVLERLFDQQSLREWAKGQPHRFPIFEEPLFSDGKLLKAHLDVRLLRPGRLEWVNGLDITRLHFFRASYEARLNSLGPLPLAQLEFLNCCLIGLTYLNLTGVPQLEYLDCSGNELEELQLHCVPLLTSLYCSLNELAELKFDRTPNLHFLACVDNRLTQLNLSALGRLEVVFCGDNKLTELQLVGLANLLFLDCRRNQISKLDLSSCPNLEEVDCSGNPISVLDIRGLKNLRVLNRSSHTKVIMDPEQEHTVQDLEAQFQMGISICYGKDLHQDCAYAEGARLFRSSAEKGHSSAQAYLGQCYYEGLGVPQDYTEAVKWFRKAADQGDAEGHYGLALQYNNGLGLPKDYAEAVKWYRKAAEQGHTGGQNNLGWCYHNGLGVPQDYSEAVKWYRKAAEQGNAHGQNNLGNSYGYGNGVPKDAIEAYKWFKLAAEQGHKDAAKELASLTSMLSPGELQEGERRYRESKRLTPTPRLTGKNMLPKNKKGYSRPKFNESVVNELVKRYKKLHPEEFPKSPRGYPANPPQRAPSNDGRDEKN